MVQPASLEHRAVAAPEPRGARPCRVRPTGGRGARPRHQHVRLATTGRRVYAGTTITKGGGSVTRETETLDPRLLAVLACPQDKGPALLPGRRHGSVQPAAPPPLHRARRHPRHADRRVRDPRRRRTRCADGPHRRRGHRSDVPRGQLMRGTHYTDHSMRSSSHTSWSRVAKLAVAALVSALIVPAAPLAVSTVSAAGLGAGGEYHPLTPQRVYDSRATDALNQGLPGPMPATPSQPTFDISLLGLGGVPDRPADVLAVVVNITVAEPDRQRLAERLRRRCAGGRPHRSSTSPPNQVVPNLSIVRPGTDGKLTIKLFSTNPSGQALGHRRRVRLVLDQLERRQRCTTHPDRARSTARLARSSRRSRWHAARRHRVARARHPRRSAAERRDRSQLVERGRCGAEPHRRERPGRQHRHVPVGAARAAGPCRSAPRTST